MSDSQNKKETTEMTPPTSPKKEYNFGGISEFSLEKIEEAILEDSVYLDVFAGSDIAFKADISPLENVLPSVLKLNYISYNYKVDEFAQKNFPKTRQLGVIAQEVKSQFPELVRLDSEGDMQVNYSQLSTVALQAVKELSSLLEKSNERISKLETEIANLKQ